MAVLYFFSIALFLVLCFLLCTIILLQESKSSGLGASFGGDTTDSLFGTSTADVLKTVTGWMSAAFLGSCIVLSFWTQALSYNEVPVSPVSSEQIEN